MKPESAAILRHIIDTIFIVILAATIVLAAWIVGHAYCKTVIAWIAQVKYVYIIVGVMSVSAVLGWSVPKKVIASFRSLKLLPKHWGLIIRGFLGYMLTLLLAWLTGWLKIETSQLAVRIIGVIGVGGSVLFVGWVLAKLHLWLRDSSVQLRKNVDTDDRPIRVLEENEFPEYEAAARRILSRLKLGRDKGTGGPNIALIGPWGSGKTSLCYLVKDISRNEQDQRIDSALEFCRFEAWQFLTADAAVRGLLDQIVNKVEDLVDCSGLGAIPEEYLETLRACPNGWFGTIAAILNRRRSPEEVVRAIQDVLLRIGARVVVFVDDFDRLENTSREAQGAISAALNQLQNLTTVQYVLCVGPMREGPGADLLKLTRFQELMPEIQGQDVIERIRDMRDKAISEEQNLYYPWNLVEQKRGDPLQYYQHREELNSTLVSQLVNLIETPRQLKVVEREIREKWNDGLKGEISWYDLLLMSVLKVSEPEVFEWILREPEVFLYEEIHIIAPTEEKKIEAKAAIEKRLRELIMLKTESRIKLIQQILLGLFPNFMKRLGGLAQRMTSREPQPWEQRIAQEAMYGTSYFRRYTSGCVPSAEVPDQPILQNINDIMKNGFKQQEFEQRYLDSYQKMTNDLNRFVQFSELLSWERGLQVCECILDWTCDRQHWGVWKQEDEYVSAVMTDVKFIFNRAGQFESVLALRVGHRSNVKTTDPKKWAEEQVKKLVSKDAIVAMSYAEYVAKDVLGENATNELFGALFKRDFLNKQAAFWEQAKGNKLYLGWLLKAFKYNNDDENLRQQVTESVLKAAEAEKSEAMAEGIVISLVHYQYPAGRPDWINEYKFSVNKEENQQMFNMDMLLPVLKRWEDRQFGDQVVSKAFEHVMAAYAEEMKGLGI